MNKKLSMFGLVLCLAVALSTQVLATDTHAWGVTNVDVEGGYTLTFQTAEGETASAYTGVVSGKAQTVYDDVAKMELTFSGETGAQYMVFLLENSLVPTQSSLRYINQTTGATETTFIIYPDTLQTATTYYIYISSTEDGYIQVGSFDVVASWVEGTYTLGDVNEDGAINSSDAVQILRYAAGLTSYIESDTEVVADINMDGSINSSDAVQVLRYAAGLSSYLD